MKALGFAVGVFAWILAIAWFYLLFTGGGKDMRDYVKRPVRSGYDIPLQSKELLWSGWWPVIDGYRLSTALRPDILFAWPGAALDRCVLELALFPVHASPAPQGNEAQRVEWRLNSSPWNGPLMVTAEQVHRLEMDGNLKAGVNVLTLRLPDARPGRGGDTRLLSIGIRRLRIDCEAAETDDRLVATSFEKSREE